jgi:hypothetical protein
VFTELTNHLTTVQRRSHVPDRTIFPPQRRLALETTIGRQMSEPYGRTLYPTVDDGAPA